MFKKGFETRLFIPHCNLKFETTQDCTVKLFWDWPATAGNQHVIVAKGLINVVKKQRMGAKLKPQYAGIHPAKGVDLPEEAWEPVPLNGYDETYFYPNGDQLNYRDRASFDVTIPANTQFSVSKLYVRNGGWGEDCINLQILKCPDPDFKIKSRLSIKLAEAYALHIRLLESVHPAEQY
jgi:hypothetical protein